VLLAHRIASCGVLSSKMLSGVAREQRARPARTPADHADPRLSEDAV
jgi:hypothetical protein